MLQLHLSDKIVAYLDAAYIRGLTVYMINGLLFSTGKNSKNMRHLIVEKWQQMYIYFDVSWN